MRCALTLLALAGCSTTPASLDVDADEPLHTVVKKAQPQANQIELNGTIINVRWGDGDTFSYKNRDGKRKSARLAGFNALESYGPVHRWGQWTPQELYRLSKEAGTVAGSRGWVCTRQPGGGGYGRLLVACPDLQKELLERGLAHVFSMKGPADAATLSVQHQAQSEGKGMWAKGVPKGMITSLHSKDERSDRDTAYNRVVNTQTGHAPTVSHREVYQVCQEVCQNGSCMIYVPYRMRYGKKRADCLR
jgi:endonuclease YncB( thermonuclease family)